MLSGSEVKIYTEHYSIKQELAKGQKDIVWMIHEILSGKIFAALESNDTAPQIPVVFG